MITTSLIVLLCGYALMALLLVLSARVRPKTSRWLGAIAIALAAPFFFCLGEFSEQFTAGQCYSNAVRSIANAVAHSTDPAQLSGQIHALPLAGYETVCAEVEAAAARLPNGTRP